MAAFFVYENTTGEILRAGVCPDGMESIQASEPNETSRAGTADEETQYFDLIAEVVEDKTPSPVTIDTSVTSVVTEADHTNGIWEQFPVGTIIAVADGLYNMAFENIPNPSRLYLNGEFLTEITDGELEFALDLPSAPVTIEVFELDVVEDLPLHTLEIKSVSSLPFEAQIHAI